MDIEEQLIGDLFTFQFTDSKRNKNVKYKLLGNNDYLVFRIFNKGYTADLFYEEYHLGEQPGKDEPKYSRLIKGSYNTDNDRHLIRSTIANYNKGIKPI